MHYLGDIERLKRIALMGNSTVDEILDYICGLSSLTEVEKQILINRIEPKPDVREWNIAQVDVDENNNKHKRT